MPYIRSVPVCGNHDETYKRYDERDVCRRQTTERYSRVDERRLKRWEYRAAEDGHYQSGSAEFDIVAQSAQGYPIDSREHQ